MSEFELFIKAIQSGSNELIIKHFNVEYMNKRLGPLKRCPMHLACDMGNIDIVKLLIDEKCNIESCDKDNWQPIHLACARGHVEIVRLLIQEKCDIAAVNRNGDSPMKLARKYQYQAIIDLLNERQSELERVWSLKTQESERLIEMMGVKCTLLCTHKQLCPNSIRSKTFPKGTKVGHGSFGDVCKMKGTGTNKEFALKYINIEDIERRYIEGRIDEFIPVLDHPRIIKYFGAIETEKKLCIFMEYFPNNSIQHKIKEEGCIGITDVVRYSKQIIEGLEFLHGKKIIHRDLKPDNILLNNEDNIKLTDFGLSRSLIKTGGITIPARTFVGTPNFTAPEIINSEPYREPADIWSVAASMINMITGKPPYHRFQSVTVLFKISSTKTIEIPDSISDEMKGFILSMLNPDPSERPSATNLLKSDLFK